LRVGLDIDNVAVNTLIRAASGVYFSLSATLKGRGMVLVIKVCRLKHVAALDDSISLS